ncbi:PAS domain-containing protein [Thalassobaculum salexigens]|uniref:PAS domain-containing protein n=1 Tax=Thalassobaculum salexigens TaxID=455360 RepID=UPI000422087F|nr:PAS domain-containing protein [Thalassobaculum salexigens]
MSFPLCRDRRIAQFFDYWTGLRVSGGIPDNAAFDPTEIGPLLPSIWKLHWEDETRDFVYRLAGEEILAMFTTPTRHRTLGEVHDRALSETLRNRYQAVCRTPVAFYSRGRIYRHLDRYGTGERLVLPLMDAKGRPRIVIGCTVYAASRWPNPSARPPAPEADLDVFTSLDGAPLERIREAG